MSENTGESYTGFAQVYDRFMDNVPYHDWADFLVEQLKKYGITGQLKDREKADDQEEQTTLEDAELKRQRALAMERGEVLDLGCGTGTLTELLDDAGYNMIGIDNSEEMLNIAMEKKRVSGREILYLLQDMREMELYGTVGAVISVCDSLNYILEEDELLDVFSLVNNYLYPGGVFIFDFNTVYKYETIIGDTTIAENREECSFIWENYYHEEELINEYDLTIFVRLSEDLFKKFSETHYQRGYTLEQMKALIERSGLEFVEAMDADTHADPTPVTERIYIVARECRKQI